MCGKDSSWYRIGILLLVLTLIVPLLTACGSDDDDDETTSAADQATTSASSAAQTAGGEPVKIGVLTSWSGPTALSGSFYVDNAIKVIEKELDDMGGILGGRPVEFVRYDTAGMTAEAMIGAEKLITKDNVCVLTIGGVSTAEGLVIADVAEKEKVLFASAMPLADVAEREYTVICTISLDSVVEDSAKLILELLNPKPQTAAIMTFNQPSSRDMARRWKELLEDGGVEIVYEEYIAPDIVDLAPYVTRIKYEDPDCLLASLQVSQFIAIAKEIVGLGGWGDTQVIGFGTATSVRNMPGGVGWIIQSPWHPSKDDPESVRFKEVFEDTNDRSPTDMHVYMYNTLWTAIHAIELAGTDDPVDIARAARSGNLEFDTPMGRDIIGTDGNNNLRNMYVQIREDGSLVPYP